MNTRRGRGGMVRQRSSCGKEAKDQMVRKCKLDGSKAIISITLKQSCIDIQHIPLLFKWLTHVLCCHLVGCQLLHQLFLFQILYGKLFFILGILWTFSFLHYLIHGNHSNTSCEDFSSYLEMFFRVIDSLNLLRGFLMFLIFVCKKTVWGKVKRSLSWNVNNTQYEEGVGELSEIQTTCQ